MYCIMCIGEMNLQAKKFENPNCVQKEILAAQVCKSQRLLFYPVCSAFSTRKLAHDRLYQIVDHAMMSTMNKKNEPCGCWKVINGRGCNAV